LKDSDYTISITETYRLSRSSHLVRINKDQGILNSTKGIRHLKGALYLDVLSLCSTKGRSFPELIRLLNESYTSTYIWYAMTELAGLRFLETTEEQESYIHIQTIEDTLILPWTSCLKEDIPLISVLSDINSTKAKNDYGKARQKKKNWLPIVIGGAVPFIGPVFTGDAPCLECLGFRVRENQSIHAWVKRNALVELMTSEWIEMHTFRLYEEIIKVYTSQWTPSGQYKNKLMALSAHDESAHNVIQRPECKHCGDHALVSQIMYAPVQLENSKVNRGFEEAYRSCSPGDIWDRFSRHVSPITGILGNLHAIADTDIAKFPVFGATFAIIPNGKYENPEAFKQSVFGKGRNEKAARVSALCEGIERASIRYRGDEPILQSTLQEIGVQAVSPPSIQHFTQDQLENPHATRSLGPTPGIFDANKITDWLPAWSLRWNERRFVPADAVLLQQPKNTRERVAVFESNGLSAGNTKEEAILQGLLELIERDAVAIWWFNQLKRPPLNTEKLKGDAWFMQTIADLQREGYNVCMLDLTTDTRIPVTAAVGKANEGWLIGYGCHFDSGIAASRALSELVQIRALMKPVSPSDEYIDVSYLVPDLQSIVIEPDLRYLELPVNTNTFIELGIDLLANLGIDTIAVNCTRPDINMPVVKVFAPGLRAFRPRFAPGRLYDVPVKLGLLSHPKSASELNSLWLTV
jgi:oxazoline/thiazoline synthase